MDHLYIIQSDISGAMKIGRSKNPKKRLKQLQTGSPYKLKLLVEVSGQGLQEKSLHRTLKDYKRKVTLNFRTYLYIINMNLETK